MNRACNRHLIDHYGDPVGVGQEAAPTSAQQEMQKGNSRTVQTVLEVRVQFH